MNTTIRRLRKALLTLALLATAAVSLSVPVRQALAMPASQPVCERNGQSTRCSFEQ